MPHEDFDFFIELLGILAETAAGEHTLNLAGIGAFWNMFGSMAEIQLPAFVYIQVC